MSSRWPQISGTNDLDFDFSTARDQSRTEIVTEIVTDAGEVHTSLCG